MTDFYRMGELCRRRRQAAGRELPWSAAGRRSRDRKRPAERRGAQQLERAGRCRRDRTDSSRRARGAPGMAARYQVNSRIGVVSGVCRERRRLSGTFRYRRGRNLWRQRRSHRHLHVPSRSSEPESVCSGHSARPRRHARRVDVRRRHHGHTGAQGRQRAGPLQPIGACRRGAAAGVEQPLREVRRGRWRRLLNVFDDCGR